VHRKVTRAGWHAAQQSPPVWLTKRRAVDFCRVATALCPDVPPSERAAAAY
jgi:hypothetical protein